MVLAAVVVVAALQVVAGDDTTPAEIVTAEPSTTVATDRTGRGVVPTTVAEPFVYRLGVLSGVSTDNFWAFYGKEATVWNSYVLGPTKPALFTANESNGELVPELAVVHVEPERRQGTWSVTIDLEPGLTWSDGTPITAHDVAFTFDTVRVLDLRGSWAGAFPETVESVEAETDHRLRIEFAERPDIAVWPHSIGLAPVMAKHVWDPQIDGLKRGELYRLAGSGDVGGGPLSISSVSDDLIVSRANPGYRYPIAPDTVEYRVYPDEEAAVEALGRGEIDSVLNPTGLAIEHLKGVEADPDVDVIASPGNSVRYLGFNLDREPMTDRAFRTALALLLDKEKLSESISVAGPAAWSLVPKANEQWFDQASVSAQTDRYQRPLGKRLKAALDGLSAAGYVWESPPSVDSDGKLVSGSGLTIRGQTPQPLTILTPGDSYDPARPEYAKAIASSLEVLGFDARPVITDFDTVVDLAFTPGQDGALHYDMYLLGWTLGNPTLPGYHGALFSAGAPMNNTGYASEAFAGAHSAFQNARTENQARRALWEMERVLAADLPYLPLYTGVVTEAFRSDRIRFEVVESLGGMQARLGGIGDVKPAG